MADTLRLRITLLQPPAGVEFRLQRGRDGLVPPTRVTPGAISFDFEVRVEPGPNFLGEFTQGPKQVRFVYVNSGQCAGQPTSCWTRRAKVPLMTITQQQIDANLPLEARISGTSKDGGPICASVKHTTWHLIPAGPSGA